MQRINDLPLAPELRHFRAASELMQKISAGKSKEIENLVSKGTKQLITLFRLFLRFLVTEAFKRLVVVSANLREVSSLNDQ